MMPKTTRLNSKGGQPSLSPSRSSTASDSMLEDVVAGCERTRQEAEEEEEEEEEEEGEREEEVSGDKTFDWPAHSTYDERR